MGSKSFIFYSIMTKSINFTMVYVDFRAGLYRLASRFVCFVVQNRRSTLFFYNRKMRCYTMKTFTNLHAV